jgi:ribosomal protein L29
MLTNQELRQLQDKEMREELMRTQHALIKAKMDHAAGSLKETHKLKQIQRSVARMKTIMKETAAAEAAKGQGTAKAASPAKAAISAKVGAKKTAKKKSK